MKIFKKALVTVIALSFALTMVACGSKKEESKETTTTQKKEIEYITEITKDNVEEIVIEYKEVLSYYNDLKNNLKILSDISNNPDLERDAITAKDSIKNGQTLLSNIQTKYKPLVEAKDILIQMYTVSLNMADSVVSDPSTYEKKLKEYEKLFKDFKTMMDDIRADVEKVRGKSPTETKTDKNSDAQKEDTDVNDVNNDTDKDDEDNKDNNSKSNNSSNNDNSSSSKSSNSNKNDQIISEKSEEFVPKVSSLNSSIRGEIKNAGYSAGANYKQGGGSNANLEQIAAQMFDDLEGDNPINSSQVSEARQIFINAFISAYNSN